MTCIRRSRNRRPHYNQWSLRHSGCGPPCFTSSESADLTRCRQCTGTLSVDPPVSLPVKVRGPGPPLSNSGQCPLSLIVTWTASLNALFLWVQLYTAITIHVRHVHIFGIRQRRCEVDCPLCVPGVRRASNRVGRSGGPSHSPSRPGRVGRSRRSRLRRLRNAKSPVIKLRNRKKSVFRPPLAAHEARGSVGRSVRPRKFASPRAALRAAGRSVGGGDRVGNANVLKTWSVGQDAKCGQSTSHRRRI